MSDRVAPNLIPPRTSSTGVTKPAAEDEWFASSARRSCPGSIGYQRGKPFSTRRGKPAEAMWTAGKENIVLGPYSYTVNQPGKDIRGQLIAAYNRWLQVPEESLAVITKVVVMLHTASLLIDDVEDSSHLRRGAPVAHNIFGIPQTINSANYVYFQALDEIQKLKSPEAINIFVKELMNLHRGQGMDLYWRDTLTCPTEEDYLEMVGNKTGGLFRLAIKLMQAESSVPIDCVPLVDLMGLMFQVCDDYLNLSNPTYSKNKGLCEDLTEGKFSFPVIHSIRAQPENRQLINILKQKTNDNEVKKYAVKYMESTGSFEYTRKVAIELRDKAFLLIDELERTFSLIPSQSEANGEAGSGNLVRAILNRIIDPVLMDSGDKQTSSEN
ncbi:geranylgeranyl pyrophosphate synthase [Trichophyton mentagrophytes]|nr:geranylgeranyl pyrophosphate synthase [Trichophyton mentagrophytes]